MLLFSRINLWQMVPIALGLHGLMFIIPVPSQDAIVERKNPKTVSVANMPKVSPKTTASPPKAQASPKPSPQPSVKPRVLESPATLSQSKPIAPTPIIATPTPSPVVSPTPTLTPSPTPSPSPKDVLQLDGAAPGCDGREGCWQIAETQGRMISTTLEKQLQDQGYQVIEKDINEDTGMRVYQVEKSGTQPYYLHFIWSDRGTAYVRHAQVLSRSELETITRI